MAKKEEKETTIKEEKGEEVKATPLEVKKEVKKKKRSEENTVRLKIPEGIDVSVESEGSTIKIKGEKGELSRKFKSQITAKKEGDEVVFVTETARKKMRALLGTAKADTKNMFSGVKDGINYKMKIVYSHFPMNLKVQGESFIIENFLGERHPRKAKILQGVKVDIKGRDVEVSGIDKGLVSQTAANIEQATKITKWDARVFQDGIYITEKDGKPLVKK